ncbi:hypothetical protein Adu01nite_59670 [Paractinoplanes durhamensis]|uniref:Fibronectin type-III domain-containing protein n=1 Tax=Paractinoplanes durhamensis TaxID=113563 RepID=A0ABQ3Z455_9ACTN|nr:fibronectin type III domain-containing protein [Actinoplanes durhamensis]GIE04617.1 hypothetical protein Adu01nite_59670 [Actinoplanes durhamensis]
MAGVLANPSPAAAAAPGTPTAANAVAGRRAILVSWTAPAGGAGHYVAAAGGQTCATASTSCSIPNLTANQAYTPTVMACTSATLTDNTECSAAVNATSATPGPPGTPGAPTVAFNGDPTKVTLKWTAPDPGAGIDSYRITASPSDGLTGSCGSLVSATTCDFAGLTAESSYTFKVTAIGVNTSAGTTGTSAAGASSVAKVAGKPHTPAKPAVARAGDNAVTVSWSKPSGNQALSGYMVTTATTNGAKLPTVSTCIPGPADTECVVGGLDLGGSYTFTVTANGENPGGGSSEPSPVSDAIVPGKPGTVAMPTVELGAVAGAVTVYWDAPEGGTVASYTVSSQRTDNGAALPDCTTTTKTSCDFTGLVNGKAYQFQVKATNAAGTTTSEWSAAIVSQLPDKPATPTAALGDATGKVVLSWAANSTGGPVIFYRVTATPATGTKYGTNAAGCGFNLTTPSCTITDLDPAVSYTFKVTAVGDLGSVDSDASTAIIPNKPGVPTTVAVALGGMPTDADVTWAAPAAGAGAVASYTVTATPSDGSAAVVGCPATSSATTTCSFSGATALDPAKSYTFKVTAKNTAGTTDATATPLASDVPSAPLTPSVALQADTPGAVDVTWTASASGTVTRYIVKATPTDTSTAPADCKTDGVTLTCAFTTLDTSKKYTFTVRAENMLGGTSAAPTAAVQPDKPGVPTSVSAAASAENQATVTWLAPITGGAVETYTVTAVDSGDDETVGCDAVSAATLTCIIAGLDPGELYTFRVDATNNSGINSAGTTTAILLDKPAAPGGVTAVLGDAPGKVTVSWTAPADAAVTGYEVKPASTDGTAAIPTTCATVAATALSCTLTGLKLTAPYTFTVVATNSVGADESGPTTAIVPDKPGAPATVTAVRGNADGKVTVNWTAPGSGGAVATYTATATPSDGTTATVGCDKVSSATLTCDFTGLVTTRSYIFKVEATNNAGGMSLATTTALIPSKPDKPANVVVSVGSPGSATVTWGAPTGANLTTGWVVTPTSSDGGATPNPATCPVAASADRTCTFTGLTTTASYTFVVQATNEAGSTNSDTTAAVVANKPNPPAAPTTEVTAGDTVRVTWLPPSSGGPVSKYSVNAYTTGAPDTAITSPACTDVTELTCDFGQLLETNTYTFRVVASGTGGDTPGDRSKTVTTAGPPKPAAPTVELSGTNAVKVTWVAPTGAGPVRSYSVTASPDMSAPARCTSVRVLTCVFDRLRSGTAYTFQVLANGTADRSTASDASVSIIPGPPGMIAAPTVAATSTAGQVTVSWVKPATGGAITGYKVLSNPGGLDCAVPASDTATSCVVSGLDAKTSYTFQVKAIGKTGGGDSEFSPASVAIVPGAPAVPTDVVVSGGDRQIDVSWTAPTDVTRVDHYRAVTTPGGFSCETTISTDTECLINGVSNLAVYTVTVSAVAKDGTLSPASVSSPRVRPTAGRPGSPTAVAATVGDGQAVVTWTAPAMVGNGIARYVVTAVNTAGDRKICITPTGTPTTCTVTGLTNGAAYTVTVASIGLGASGYSDASTPITVTPKAPPAVPSGVTVVAGVKALTVSWKAATSTEGLAGYTATATNGATSPACTAVATATSCAITVAAAGPYTVSVVARGTTTGLNSAPSTPIEATALTAVAPAQATTLPTSGGTLTLSSSTVKVGGTVTVTGIGLAPYSGVSFAVYTPTLTRVTTTAVTDSKGGFTVEVALPSTVTAGSRTLVAAAQTSATSTTTKYLTGAITVSAPPSTQ